ncbi:hypothetical protein EJ04DRAFT_563608 [Polyplosphaeria fusca]|uniref:Uncharacterized protein n=1 Tax=Polyplosphaeria fusca TaxID=682080 RepID=A0A9P4V0A5_9PLEO|nr:hypothetical protein EJ04DRAFT_563608 [Polyplosphaeria fusca]
MDLELSAPPTPEISPVGTSIPTPSTSIPTIDAGFFGFLSLSLGLLQTTGNPIDVGIGLLPSSSGNAVDVSVGLISLDGSALAPVTSTPTGQVPKPTDLTPLLPPSEPIEFSVDLGDLLSSLEVGNILSRTTISNSPLPESVPSTPKLTPTAAVESLVSLGDSLRSLVLGSLLLVTSIPDVQVPVSVLPPTFLLSTTAESIVDLGGLLSDLVVSNLLPITSTIEAPIQSQGPESFFTTPTLPLPSSPSLTVPPIDLGGLLTSLGVESLLPPLSTLAAENSIPLSGPDLSSPLSLPNIIPEASTSLGSLLGSLSVVTPILSGPTPSVPASKSGRESTLATPTSIVDLGGFIGSLLAATTLPTAEPPSPIILLPGSEPSNIPIISQDLIPDIQSGGPLSLSIGLLPSTGNLVNVAASLRPIDTSLGLLSLGEASPTPASLLPDLPTFYRVILVRTKHDYQDVWSVYRYKFD